MTEEESIIVRAAKILMAPTPPTPEPTSPAPTSEPEGANFGSFFMKSVAITGVILVAMNWEAITSFWVVTQ